MRVWLDDLRIPDNSWIWVKNVPDAQAVLEFHVERIAVLSLDHDLGEDTPTGYDLTKWMAEFNVWPRGEIRIHSGNPVGVENMRSTILRYGPYVANLGNVSFRYTGDDLDSAS
jgi:hypothetical protein